MILTIPKCPSCKEGADHSVDLVAGDAQFTDEAKRGLDLDFEGDTKIDWDLQENALDTALRIVGGVVNVDDFMLVGCVNGHQWITGVKRETVRAAA